MVKKRWLAVLVAAACSMSVYGCSDDDPAGPGNGNGGGGGTKITAGVYDLTLSRTPCGTTDTETIIQQDVLCEDFAFEELFEIDCPVTITNGSFDLDCTSTVDNGFCSYQERVQVTGTKVGDTWTITGTITISDENPPDCADDLACYDVMVVIERVSDPPSACTYADANTIEATVGGGPFAGRTDFFAFGSGSGVGGIFAWNFFGEVGSGIFVQQAAASSANFANISISLADIDVNSLPATFSLTVIGEFASSSALPSGSVSYIDETTAGAVFFGSSGSGEITVNEVSDSHIAGRINSLSIDGMTIPAGGGEPTPSTRSLSGGFHVRSFSIPQSEPAAVGGWAGRILSKW